MLLTTPLFLLLNAGVFHQLHKPKHFCEYTFMTVWSKGGYRFRHIKVTNDIIASIL